MTNDLLEQIRTIDPNCVVEKSFDDLVKETNTQWILTLLSQASEQTKQKCEKAQIAADLIDKMEALRIDIDSEIYGCALSNEILYQKYERANEMLDDCLSVVRSTLMESEENSI